MIILFKELDWHHIFLNDGIMNNWITFYLAYQPLNPLNKLFYYQLSKKVFFIHLINLISNYHLCILKCQLKTLNSHNKLIHKIIILFKLITIFVYNNNLMIYRDIDQFKTIIFRIIIIEEVLKIKISQILDMNLFVEIQTFLTDFIMQTDLQNKLIRI